MMTFAIFIHGEKVPAFVMEAEGWQDAMAKLADELEARADNQTTQGFRLQHDGGGLMELTQLTVHWMRRQ